MSRAFVKESDDAVEALPERPVSTAPNHVTVEGLAAIEAAIERLTRELGEAGEDAAARASISRDLRYWSARRGSAHVAPNPPDNEHVHFGSTVTIAREDGRHVYRIVGEDEADPERGTISHVSPMARALLGKAAGDVVKVGKSDIEIVSIGEDGSVRTPGRRR